MGNAVYPVLPGRTWDTTTVPLFNTKTLKSISLNEFRASFAATPIYHFKLGYDVLRDAVLNGNDYDEWRPLIGFFMSRRGSWDSFLYSHPDDHEAVAQQFGVGDSIAANFNLSRTLGGFTERVANVEAITEISVDNVPTVDYTVNDVGRVTFTSAPAGNAVLTWSGSYYFRCRFTNDSQEFNQFMHNLWNAKAVEFDGSLGTKI